MDYPRQFAILKKNIDLPGYSHVNLEGGWILSYQQDLKLYSSPCRDVFLLGIAWQALPGAGSPEEECGRLKGDSSDEEILAAEESWCGRYVLICGSRVFLDCSGMLGVYYSKEGISSHAGLLAEAMGLGESVYVCGPVMNWMPGPYTHYKGIYRLLPSQIYDYRRRKLRPKALLSSSVKKFRSQESLIRYFTDIFCNSLHNMAGVCKGKKLLLALTGGYDSRTLYALALKAGIDFESFSLEHDDMLEGDIEIPKVLSEKTSCPFHYLKRDRGRFSKDLEQAYNRFLSGMVRDEDRLFYAHGQYQDLMDKYGETVFLRSSVWENTIEYFRRLFEGENPGPEFYPYFELEKGSLERRSMEAYFRWCKKYPQAGVNLSNRFLWEQREGCWLSTIEQGFDILEGAWTLQPVNCRLMMTLLFIFPRQERLTKKHQDRIISYACPAISGIDYAVEKIHEESRSQWLKKKTGKLVRRLKQQGLSGTLKTYISIFRFRMEQRKLMKDQ